MSTLTLALHQRFQPQPVPVEQSAGGARQLDLPFQCLRVLRVILGGLYRRIVKPSNGIVYFGKSKQYVCIGTMVRRVSQ